jgi:hypothetical protein
MGCQCLPLAPGAALLPAGATAASAAHTRVENNLSHWAGQGQARPRGPRSAGLGQSTDSDFSFDYRILKSPSNQLKIQKIIEKCIEDIKIQTKIF